MPSEQRIHNLTPGPAPVVNRDVDWDQWPVQQYLAENYHDLHPCDAAVIEHHSAYYRTLSPGSIDRSLEFGAGPNLYPLMLASACSRHIDALEPSAANVAYLRAQLENGPDDSWTQFHARCRQLNPDVPDTPTASLRAVRVLHGMGSDVPPGTYDLASMSFVAEGVTASMGEFRDFVRTFCHAVKPGGHLVAAFMENLGNYQLGERDWPGLELDADDVSAAFDEHTMGLVVRRIDANTLPEYGHTGMVLLSARRTGATPAPG